MISKEYLEERLQALHDFVELPNDSVNIEKKRKGIQSIETELAQVCPSVREYEPYPDYGVMNYQQDFARLPQTTMQKIVSFVAQQYSTIKEYEGIDEGTKKLYNNKLKEYYRPSFYIAPVNPDDPDCIFMSDGSYRQFCSYQSNKAYLVARKMRGVLEEKGEEYFLLHFHIYLLYSAAINELAEVEKAEQAISILIKRRDGTPEARPNDDNVFPDPESSPEAYNSLLLLEFIRIFQSAEAALMNTVPEGTKEEIGDILTRLVDNYWEWAKKKYGSSFEMLSQKLSSWENLIADIAQQTEEKIPRIVCYDSQASGDTSSSCIKRYIISNCKNQVNNHLRQLAFCPRGREIGIIHYNFWGDNYETLVEQYRGKRGLPDAFRALFKQEDNDALLKKKVVALIAQAIDESQGNATKTDSDIKSLVLAKVKAYCQQLFFSYCEYLEGSSLSKIEKDNASLGWIYFTKVIVGNIAIPKHSYTEGSMVNHVGGDEANTLLSLGSGEIFEDMRSRFIIDNSSLPTIPNNAHCNRFVPQGNKKLKLDRLYEYLSRDDVRVIIVSKTEFENAVYNADVTKLFEDAESLGSKTKVKILIQVLKSYFPVEWYDAVSGNCGMNKTELSNINYQRSSMKEFKKVLKSIPLI